jgi:hypothetical protein
MLSSKYVDDDVVTAVVVSGVDTVVLVAVVANIIVDA